jgi:hypothetical protein
LVAAEIFFLTSPDELSRFDGNRAAAPGGSFVSAPRCGAGNPCIRFVSTTAFVSSAQGDRIDFLMRKIAQNVAQLFANVI